MKIRDRIKEFRRVKASELLPCPRNWRKHPEAQQNALRNILAEVGIADVLLVRETPNGLMLIDGHLRAETDGDVEWPVAVLDVTEKEADLLLASVDPIAEMAEPDPEKLADLLSTLDIESEELKALLEAKAGVNAEPVEGLTDPDEVPEVPAEPVTQPGDLWILGEHRLLCGDSTKAEDVALVMNGERFDGAIADPPYSSGGMTRGDRQASTTSKYVQSGTMINESDRPDFAGDNKDQRSWIGWCERWLGLYLQFAKEGSVLGLWIDWRQLPAITDAIQGGGWLWRGIAVWDKTEAARPLYGRFRPQCEFLVWGSAGRLPINDGSPCYPGVVSKAVDSNKQHITQKPVDVAIWSASMVPKSGIVFDGFIGSGTTIIAAEQEARRCFGIEISPHYCDIAVQRWEAFTGKQAVLEQRGT